MFATHDQTLLRDAISKLGTRDHVVLLSGGQDSTTVLLMAMKLAEQTSGKVHTLGINYGQQHVIELEQARAIGKDLGVASYTELSFPTLVELSDSALVGSSMDLDASVEEINAKHRGDATLPASFVPGRNSIFLTLAATLAYKINAGCIWIGANATDYSGYPDCRGDYLDAKEVELRLMLDRPKLTLVAPLLHLTKEATFKVAHELGRLDFIIERTHTCYSGNRTKRPWGYGCGACSACMLRERGWIMFSSWRNTAEGQKSPVGHGG